MLGDNIRKFRKQHPEFSTLEKLANKMGLTESGTGTLSHIENGTRNPSLEMLNRIADALGVTALDLMAGDSQAENYYFNELNRMAYPDSSQTIANDMDKAINAEAAAKNSTLREAEQIYSVDPELFVTMCRAKELPEEDRKMLKDLSARLLDMHHNKKKGT